MNYIIGITGGIATGKSYVSKYITRLGYKVIDTDVICHELEEYNKKGYLEIKKHFSEAFINDKLDRKVLGSIIFGDNEKRNLLNQIMHPLIKEESIRQIKEINEKIVFLDVPLMYEAGFDELCYKIICVTTSKNIQLKRLMERDKISESDAIKRIESQMPLSLKANKAHYIIESDEDFSITNQNIEKIIKEIEDDINAKNI